MNKGTIRAIALTVVPAILLLGVTVHSAAAENEQPTKDGTERWAYVGVALDPSPLDSLLAKHLRLDADEGLLIRNVQLDSPADKAMLERDDIIVGFEGEPVRRFDDFVGAIHEAGIGTEVTLEVIHLGQRKSVELTIEAKPDHLKWKHHFEPERTERIRPGRIWRRDPGAHHWRQIPFESLPDVRRHLNRFFSETYVYSADDGESDCRVIIEGDPDEADTRLTVRTDDAEYQTTIAEIDKLPEKYQEFARDAVKSARESVGWSGPHDLEDDVPDPWPDIDDMMRRGPRWLPDDSMGNLGRQFEELRNRMRRMEERHEELLKQLQEGRDDAERKL